MKSYNIIVVISRIYNCGSGGSGLGGSEVQWAGGIESPECLNLSLSAVFGL
jgi:glucose-6-phosphate isomerase